MPGGPPGGAMPPGMMMPGANGAPFDMSKIKEMLEDPAIKDMAKQIAEDPAFKSMAENMQASMARAARFRAPPGRWACPRRRSQAGDGGYAERDGEPRVMQIWRRSSGRR